MSEQPTTMQELPPFRAILHPHRSLGRRGFLLLMIGIGLVGFVTGMAFLAIGAWPVLGFFGLDVLLVYVAFQLNYRSGRCYELVELTPDLLKVTHVQPSGRMQSFEFNPFWVRVQLKRWKDGSHDLRLASHGRELSIGQFLTDDERCDFASALQGALLTARGGPRQ